MVSSSVAGSLSKQATVSRPGAGLPSRPIQSSPKTRVSHGILSNHGCRASITPRHQTTSPCVKTAAHETSTVVLSKPPGTDTQQDARAAPLSWTAHWWPVMLVEDLNPTRPLKVDLLGESLVLWADSKGQWHCMEDRCPHRVAPLSDGRVEGDQLHCSYHGWRFDSRGQCTHIPQLEYDPKAHATACGSPRSCVKAYPVTVQYGLLFVWPEAGDKAALQAACTVPGQGLPKQLYETTDWFVRELPIRFDTLCENLLDPTHVPFSHHGVGPIKRSNIMISKIWDRASLGEVNSNGFTMTAQGGSEVQFIAPANIRYCYMPPPGSKMPPGSGPKFFVVPTKPGWSKIFWDQMKPKMPCSLHKISYMEKLYKAFVHMVYKNLLLDGDTYFVHVAERRLPVADGIGLQSASRVHFMPAPGDSAVVGLRKWLQLMSGTVPTCRPEDEARMPGLMPPEQVLDRWTQHTQHCDACRTGLALVDRLRGTAAAVGALAAMSCVACCMALAVVPATASCAPVNVGPITLVSALVCSLCVWAHQALTTIRQKFFYEEYVHALKN